MHDNDEKIVQELMDKIIKQAHEDVLKYKDLAVYAYCNAPMGLIVQLCSLNHKRGMDIKTLMPNLPAIVGKSVIPFLEMADKWDEMTGNEYVDLYLKNLLLVEHEGENNN